MIACLIEMLELPNKVEVMITSLIELLELPNFGHMTISTI